MTLSAARLSAILFSFVVLVEGLSVPQLCKKRYFGYKIQDPEDCHGFYVCLGNWGQYSLECDRGYRFNETLQKCIKGKCPPCPCLKSSSDNEDNTTGYIPAVPVFWLLNGHNDTNQQPLQQLVGNTEKDLFMKINNESVLIDLNILSFDFNGTALKTQSNTTDFRVDLIMQQQVGDKQKDGLIKNNSSINFNKKPGLKPTVTLTNRLIGRLANLDSVKFASSSEFPSASTESLEALSDLSDFNTEASMTTEYPTSGDVLGETLFVTTIPTAPSVTNFITQTATVPTTLIPDNTDETTLFPERSTVFTTAFLDDSRVKPNKAYKYSEKTKFFKLESNAGRIANELTETTTVVETATNLLVTEETTTLSYVDATTEILQDFSLISENMDETTSFPDSTTERLLEESTIRPTKADKSYKKTIFLNLKRAAGRITNGLIETTTAYLQTTEETTTLSHLDTTTEIIQDFTLIPDNTYETASFPDKSPKKTKFLNLKSVAGKIANVLIETTTAVDSTTNLQATEETTTETIQDSSLLVTEETTTEATTTVIIQDSSLKTAEETTTLSPLDETTEVAAETTTFVTEETNTEVVMDPTRPATGGTTEPPLETTREIHTEGTTLTTGETTTLSPLETTTEIVTESTLLPTTEPSLTTTLETATKSTQQTDLDGATETTTLLSREETTTEMATETTTQIKDETTTKQPLETTTEMNTDSTTLPAEETTESITKTTTLAAREITTLAPLDTTTEEATETSTLKTDATTILPALETTTEIETETTTLATQDITTTAPLDTTTETVQESTKPTTTDIATNGDTTTQIAMETTTLLSRESTTLPALETSTEMATETTTMPIRETTTPPPAETTTDWNKETTTENIETTTECNQRTTTTAIITNTLKQTTTPKPCIEKLTTTECKTQTTKTTTTKACEKETTTTTCRTSTTTTTCTTTTHTTTCKTTTNGTPTTTSSTCRISTTICGTTSTYTSISTKPAAACNQLQTTTAAQNNKNYFTENNQQIEETDINFICAQYEKVYFIKHPQQCNQYYSCYKKRAYLQTCPGRFMFDEKLQICNYPEAVNCEMKTPKANKAMKSYQKKQQSSLELKPNDCRFMKSGTFIRDPDNCNKYYVCLNGQAVAHFCPRDQYFDIEGYVCNFKALVKNCRL